MTDLTIEQAFRLRTPDAFDNGIMDDRVTRLHWTRLRDLLKPDLPPQFRGKRYTPAVLVDPENEDFLEAVRGAHDKRWQACQDTINSRLPDEDVRQALYVRRRWPEVLTSDTTPIDYFDPLSEWRVGLARRCFDCYQHKLRPEARALVAYACFLIALGEPVPDDVARILTDDFAEEAACLRIAEEFSGYGNWSIRSGHLRIFGAYVDPYERQPQSDAFDHPSKAAFRPGKPFDMGSEWLWRESFGRDLDGFLLTPVGPRRTLRFRLSARQSQGGTIGHENPTLVVWEHRDGSASGSFWEGYTLVSLLRRSSNPDPHVWGPRLTPADVAPKFYPAESSFPAVELSG